MLDPDARAPFYVVVGDMQLPEHSWITTMVLSEADISKFAYIIYSPSSKHGISRQNGKSGHLRPTIVYPTAYSTAPVP